jgi:hypothetical protein
MNTMKRIVGALPLALLVVLVWTYGIFAVEWEYIYEGDVLPDDPSLGNKAAGVYKTDGINTSDVGKITPDGELHMTDPADKVCFFLPEAKGVENATVEARVRVLSQAGASYTILFGIESETDAWLDLFPDRVQIEGGPSHNIDMTEYHILRVTKDGDAVTVYVDDEKVMEGPASGISDRKDDIVFGAGSTGGTGEHFWDYLVYTTAGAFSPEELPNFLSTMAVESKGKVTTFWGMLKSRH